MNEHFHFGLCADSMLIEMRTESIEIIFRPGMKSVRCQVCGEQFEKKRSLLSHMVAKHGDKDQRPRNFKCTVPEL